MGRSLLHWSNYDLIQPFLNFEMKLMIMKKIIAPFAILVSFSSCVTLYKPNAVQSPMLKEKGDFAGTASLGILGTGYANGQAAYAVSEDIGVMVNGMAHSRIYNDGNSTENLNILSSEAAIGFFEELDGKNDQFFHCYIGGGLGSAHDILKYSDSTLSQNPKISSHYWNSFIQPGISFFNKNWEFALDLKANFVKMYRIDGYLYDRFEFWNTDYNFYTDTSLSFLNLEPAFTIRAGNNGWRGLCQLGMVLPTWRADNYFSVNNNALFGFTMLKFSLGLGYYFNRGEAEKRRNSGNQVVRNF